jgi:hypothetical protein
MSTVSKPPAHNGPTRRLDEITVGERHRRDMGDIDGLARSMAAAPIRTIIAITIDQLASEPHDTIPGLKCRYYYRGSFVLLEHLSPRGLAVNAERLRRRGERDHADKLEKVWRAANRCAP